ncbi:MAG: DUF4230 domain-containing protein [Bacteroidia bacterium]|nr:DUF4230 domain-containing protein [Bacteroidia bacterium]
MITSIITFFRWVGFRNILTFALVIVIFFLIKNRFFNKTDEQIQVTSLFQKIEYVENLRLVSYFYEEIVAIGTSDRLQKLVNKAEDKVEEAKRSVIFAELIRDSLKIKMERAIESHEAIDTTLIRIEDDLLALSDSLDKFDVGNFKKLMKMSPQRQGLFEGRIRKMIQEYRLNEPGPGTRNRDRRFMKQRQKELQEDIMKVMDLKAKRFKELRDSKKKVFQQMSRQSKVLRKDLKDVKRKAENNFQDAAQKVLKLRGELEKEEEDLLEARAELEKLEGDPLPKLLVVVSAEVTGMVNLQEMQFETIGRDSLAVTQMPQAITDSVYIRMSNTKRFLAGKKKNGLFSSAEEGLYFEVYQQLKDAIIETESRVRKKAIESGILDETNRMAHDYIRDVGKSTGFNVGFAEAESASSPIEEFSGPDSTELKNLSDSLDILLKEDAQKTRSINSRSISDTQAVPSSGNN